MAFVKGTVWKVSRTWIWIVFKNRSMTDMSIRDAKKELRIIK